MSERRILGIDIGTTKVALVLFSPENPEDSKVYSADHKAGFIPCPGYAEQVPEKIFECLEKLLVQIPAELAEKIEAVGLTGQMHSVVLLNAEKASSIVTWQDRRASVNGNLEHFRKLSGCPLSDGFAGTTLAQMSLENTLPKLHFCTDPADWIGARLTGCAKPPMDPTFAASWGIYDIERGRWNEKALDSLKIPRDLLPEMIPSGSVIGKTKGVRGLQDGVDVFCAIGDNQASVIGTSKEVERELFLTLGTGAQFSAVLSKEERERYVFPPGLEIRPFTEGRFLVVNAPLCGGRAWAWLGDMVNSFLEALGIARIPEKELLDRLDDLAVHVSGNSGLVVHPDFSGVRGRSDIFGSISGITLENMTLQNLAGALGSGIIANLIKPFPPELLKSRIRIAGSGNCVRHCRAIRMEIEKQTARPLELREIREEAATGAAIMVSRIRRNTHPLYPPKKQFPRR